MKPYFIGDSCLVWSLGHKINTETSQRVLQAYRKSKEVLKEDSGVKDVVPSYTELAFYVDPIHADLNDLRRKIKHILTHHACAGHKEGKPATFLVDYSGEDLSRVADFNNISVRDVIERHKAVTYTVAMIGFLPHFPYLIGLDPGLATPRLDSPRKRVPAGAVAIGGGQTGIYPTESPGGWNIIGMTNPLLLKTLEPGDRVTFVEAA